MVNFGGWDMPLEYSGILSEHEAVRTRAGLFDVSHMGEIEVRGREALDLVQWVSCNDASKLIIGQAHYSGLMTDRGTFVDDLLVHKIADDHYFLCVNASNQDRDFAHIAAQNKFSGGNGLPFADSRVVHHNGLVTNGPFGEIKETIGGYIVVKADSLEEAVEFAKGCPVLQGPGNTVEVRKIAKEEGVH